MSLLEIFATVTTVLCVLLAVKRNVWNYPIGIVGTIAFFFVFWNAGLVSSAYLQVFFTFVQIYGWWFWLKGDRGAKPIVTTTSPLFLCSSAVVVLLASACLSVFTSMMGAQMAFLDASIFGLSVLAQFLMDRKKLESWPTWALVNVISIIVYGGQGLWVTTALYAGLLVNTAWGYYEWRKAMLAKAI